MPQPKTLLPSATPSSLNQERLAQGVRFLCALDPDLSLIHRRYGPPPLWAREPGFPTLVQIILEQQVSLASAKAAYDRLRAAVDPLTPDGFLGLDDPTLKAIGFSRQKTRYGRDLARTIREGRLDLDALSVLEDPAVRTELTKVKGIGQWTADIYLLMVLGRPDIWPQGDIALATAVHRVKQLPSPPTRTELDALSANWRPWRAVAARLLWHYYLSS